MDIGVAHLGQRDRDAFLGTRLGSEEPVEIGYEKKAHRAHLSIDTGKQNWLRAEHFVQLSEAMAKAERDNDVVFLVIESKVNGVFSFGCDVTDAADKVDPEPLIRNFVIFARQLLNTRLITVAKIDGLCIGGGFELVLLCSLSYVSTRSTFRFPEILIGCAPPIAAAIYPAIVGRSRALDHLLHATKISAAEADKQQIVSEVFDAATFEADFERRLDELEQIALANRETAEALSGWPSFARQYLSSVEVQQGLIVSAMATAFSRIARRQQVRDAFGRMIGESIFRYKVLTEKGIIAKGVREYWKHRNRDVKESKQVFRGDWI
ncbi:MAG TPA: enoyl-CoA hydratase/isomerase family protein [Vicinamibacterales bacterium]|nr:enoyl-CoA hydratase/isomerase family protein [Vicinamibacterales bacterium]